MTARKVGRVGQLNVVTAALPTTANDASQGYGVGSIWSATSEAELPTFICIDNTLGAAKWKLISQRRFATLYNTAGTFTWVRPTAGWSSKARVRILAIGFGGPGGGGGRNSTSSAVPTFGGTSGGSGAVLIEEYDLDFLTADLVVTLGSRALGGAGATVDGATGATGTATPNITILGGNMDLRCPSGTAGGGGGTAAGAVSAGGVATFTGAAGVISSTTGTPSTAGFLSGWAPGPGGAGGGVDAANAARAGGSPGKNQAQSTATPAGAVVSGIDGAAVGVSIYLESNLGSGVGGPGGSGHGNGKGGNGAQGGDYGGGGGGGGGAHGGNGGDGGNGGLGAVLIIVREN